MRTEYRQSKIEALASFFESNPNHWVDGRLLEPIAGRYAWRTRVSDLRLKRGMVIENRLLHHETYIISEYRYVPGQEAV